MVNERIRQVRKGPDGREEEDVEAWNAHAYREARHRAHDDRPADSRRHEGRRHRGKEGRVERDGGRRAGVPGAAQAEADAEIGLQRLADAFPPTTAARSSPPPTAKRPASNVRAVQPAI